MGNGMPFNGSMIPMGSVPPGAPLPPGVMEQGAPLRYAPPGLAITEHLSAQSLFLCMLTPPPSQLPTALQHAPPTTSQRTTVRPIGRRQPGRVVLCRLLLMSRFCFAHPPKHTNRLPRQHRLARRSTSLERTATPTARQRWSLTGRKKKAAPASPARAPDAVVPKTVRSLLPTLYSTACMAPLRYTTQTPPHPNTQNKQTETQHIASSRKPH